MQSSMSISIDGKSILLDAVHQVLEDASFRTKSPVAIDAWQSAVQMNDWCKQGSNEPALQLFAQKLVTTLSTTLRIDSHGIPNRFKLWELYFTIRSSKQFIQNWVTFLSLMKVNPTPVLYQHLTDIVFKSLIRSKLLFQTQKSADEVTLMVTSVEANALRYVAGYVCHHVCNTIRRKKHPMQDDLLLCLSSLVKLSGDGDDDCGTAEEWTNLVDRGGLVHVNEITYALFISLENEIRDCLKSLPTGIAGPSSDRQTTITHRLVNNDDVQFYWCMIAANFEVDDLDTHSTLLNMIVDLFITIRGFSYSNAWMEKFKQQEKTTTQSLRRKLCTDNTDE